MKSDPLERFLLCTVSLIFVLTVLAYYGMQTAVPVLSLKDEAPPILVIDPGHGGDDGGAQAECGLTEDTVNLNVARRVGMIADFCGVQSVMTRTTAEIDYPTEANTVKARKIADQKQRVALVNSTENAILISIHQNKFPDSRPRGPQVFYGRDPSGAVLADLINGSMTAALYPENRRLPARISDDIYLMKQVNCPAVLVECGFLSNPEEADLLGKSDYQLRIAAALMAGYLQYL